MELSKRAMSIKASTTMAISSKAAEMKAAGLPVVTFGAGEPDFNTPEHIRQAGIDAINNGIIISKITSKIIHTGVNTESRTKPRMCTANVFSILILSSCQFHYDFFQDSLSSCVSSEKKFQFLPHLCLL